MNISAGLLAGSRGHHLASIAQTTIASRFHCWYGASGRRYVVSVFPVDRATPDRGLPDFDGCIVIPVRREGSGRDPLFIRRVEDHFDARSVRSAGLEGAAEEWHVHLLAEDEAARQAAVDDLRRAQG